MRYEELTRKLERKLQELDGELAVQRQVGPQRAGAGPFPGPVRPRCPRGRKTAVS